MLSRYRSKSQMGLDFPLDKFERWPNGTYSFCPRCGLDMFELLYKTELLSYIKCAVCGAQWITGARPGISIDVTLP